MTEQQELAKEMGRQAKSNGLPYDAVDDCPKPGSPGPGGKKPWGAVFIKAWKLGWVETGSEENA